MSVQARARADAAPTQPPSRTSPARGGARRAPTPRPCGRAVREAPRSLSLDGQPALFSIALLVWLGLLLAISLRRLWPLDLPVVAGGLLLLNIATFFSYAFDKSAAEQGRWRTSEKTLHALAAAGGWPAAWLAQRALRHKSRKQPFLTIYVLTVLLNLGALGLLLWRGL